MRARKYPCLEPVVDPAQTLHLIEQTHEFVDLFWVGKLNNMPELERTIDWPKFRGDAEKLLKGLHKNYRLKHQLIEATSP